MIAYPFLLIGTIAIESGVATATRGGARLSATLACAAAANLFTHPLGTLAHAELGIDWWIVEAAVTGVEAILYRIVLGTSGGRSLTIALLANAATAAIGWLLGRG